jgi:hypothetical protein
MVACLLQCTYGTPEEPSKVTKTLSMASFLTTWFGDQSCRNSGVIVICAKKGLKQMKKQVRRGLQKEKCTLKANSS